MHTLITTRPPDLNYPSVRLKTLTTEEGVRLLNSGERRFGGEAAALALVAVGEARATAAAPEAWLASGG